MRYEVKPNQSLFDVAIEVYGDVGGVLWLLADNAGLAGATGPLFVGEKLTIRAQKLNVRAAAYLADFAPFQTIEARDMPRGIGFWRVEDYLTE